ncbi:MAG: CrcB family protein [Saprospiraceae bacterium]|nr:CrcB family protein [Saprospiraceae bacterium]
MEWLAVFLGGGLGSLVRFSMSRLMTSKAFNFSWATPVANLLSCIVLGALMAFLTKSGSNTRLFWMVGFCGGFSTFSTFTAETYQYIQESQWYLALANIFGSVLICLLGLIIGMRLVP